MIGELAGLGSAATWAVASVVMRSLSNRINPVMVNGVRCGFTALATAGTILALGQTGLLLAAPPSGVALVVASSVIGQGFGDAFYVISMKSIGASRAMPISNIHPLLTAALAVVFLGERVTWLQAGGTLLVLVAVYLLALPYGPFGQVRELLATADRGGLLLALGTATCWAVAATILKSGVESAGILATSLIRTTLASALPLGFLTFTAGRKALEGIDRRAVAILAATGALGILSALGYPASVFYAGAAKAAVLASTMPLFGVPLSIFILRERVNSRIALGAILCVVGIWLVLLG